MTLVAKLVAERTSMRSRKHDALAVAVRLGRRLGGVANIAVESYWRRFEGSGRVEVDIGKQLGVVDRGRRAVSVDGGRGIGRGGLSGRGTLKAIKPGVDFAATANVASAGSGALGDDAEPRLPDVVADSDVEAESAKDEDFEVVDVLEGDARDGGERLVAVRVVLERLWRRAKSQGGTSGRRDSKNVPCWRA
jgi:hypothetical protein